MTITKEHLRSLQGIRKLIMNQREVSSDFARAVVAHIEREIDAGLAVQDLDSPVEAQQHQTENLVAALTMDGKTMETLDLQAVKDQLSTAAHGITAAEAWAKGICIDCKEPAAPKCHTPEGHGEYRISAMCEECFDKMAEECEDEEEAEARWPICPECLTSLTGEPVNDFSDAEGNTTGTIHGIPSVCPECNLEFGVKFTEEVKPIE
jgi:hypothetical protein